MDKKYWVPALDKASRILALIAEQPHQLKLMELSKQLAIHKSSMFSMLHTMEELRWVVRDKADRYAIGSFFGMVGGAYFKQYSLIDEFHREAEAAKERIGETIQLATLEGNKTLYLAKLEAPTPVRLVSEPGMTFPAHQTALGKMMLAGLDDASILELYPQEQLAAVTPYTLSTRADLLADLQQIRNRGFALDLQEAVVGFKCIAAAIHREGKIVGAVSCSMPQHHWEEKQEAARLEICSLAERLSLA